MKRPECALAAALALALAAAGVAAAPSPDIIPAPLKADLAPGAAPVRIVQDEPIRFAPADAEAAFVARRLAELARRSRGLRLRPTPARNDRPGPAIVLQRDAALAPEAYRLEIGAGGARITAADDAGLFYGMASLWQLMTADAERGPVALTAQAITDRPRFSWRGLLLDSARHMQSEAEIERLIDWMALHKLNVLQWHLTDDQGWRLPVPAYPRLVSVGAWRAPAPEPWRDRPPPPRYGGYYSEAQIRRIVAFARRRGVTIVPEIESPGHALPAVLAYPRFGFTGGATAADMSDWGVFPAIFDPSRATLAFLEAVLGRTMDLFPGPFIAIGGDEAMKDAWRGSSAVQERIKALGLADDTALQAWFTRQICDFVSAHGRRAIGWDDILAGAPPPSTAVAAWRSGAALAAASTGRDVVVATAPTLYFDNRQSLAPGEPPGRGVVVSLRDVYAFQPLPAGIAPAANAHVLGLQGALWTEEIRSDEELERMALPRAAALAEIAWTAPERLDFDDFTRRLQADAARTRGLGLRADAPGAPLAPTAAVLPSQALGQCSAKLPLNLEDPWLPAGAGPVDLVDILDSCWTVPPRKLDGVRGISLRLDVLPYNFELGPDAWKLVRHPPTMPAGDLTIRLDTCAGPVVASAPLPSAPHDGSAPITAALAPQTGSHALCVILAAPKLNPLWAIRWVSLGPVRS
ncbi:MAG TPA: family 20 glycosylhydrolase [Caulobacteraceae bacterium]|nr:family 20 glycosylhydrolase [Caulobacteraceae bacterium]